MVDTFHKMTLRDEDIVRYALDGEPLPQAAETHLKNCVCCQRRLGRYMRLNGALLARLYRSQCPGKIRLSQYCVGMLSTGDAIQITGHLEECPLCAAEVAEMRRLQATTFMED